MIHILTAVHNRQALTVRFLKNIYSLPRTPQHQVWLVDDNSTDGTDKMVKKRFPQVKLIKSLSKNDLWWTASMNLGLGKILPRAKQGDFILFINDDVVVKKHYLKKMLATSKAHPDAIIGSLARDIKPPHAIVKGGMRFNFKTADIVEIIPKTTQPLQVDTLTTRGTLIRVNAIQKIGAFDRKHFQHYTSDHDFFLRASKIGYDLILDCANPVYVDPDTSGFRKQGKLSVAEMHKMLFSPKSPAKFSNRLHFYWKHSVGWRKFFNSGRYVFWVLKLILTRTSVKYT